MSERCIILLCVAPEFACQCVVCESKLGHNLAQCYFLFLPSSFHYACDGLFPRASHDLYVPVFLHRRASFAFAVLARTGKDWRSVRESAQAALEALFGFLRVIVNNVFLRPEWRTTHKL